MIKQALFAIAGFIVMAVITGCATRTAYHDSYMTEDKAVLYVYRPNSVYNNENVYDVIIDDIVKGQIYEDAYTSITIDPGHLAVTIRNHDAIMGNVEKKTITFESVQAGNAYYIRIDVTERDIFKAEAVGQERAKEEIAKTSLVDADAKKFKVYKSAGTVEEVAPAPVSTSEEIEKLYSLKEKGAITEEEYNMLKAKAIAK